MGQPEAYMKAEEPPQLVITIDAAQLTEAIARVMVERGKGAERLQAIEQKQITHHIRQLLAELHIGAHINQLVENSIKALVLEKLGPYLGKVEETITCAFKASTGQESLAMRVVRDSISARVREVLYSNRNDLLRQIDKRVADVVQGILPTQS